MKQHIAQKAFFAFLAKNDEYFELLPSCPWCGGEACSPWGEQSSPGFLTVECGSCGVVYVRRRFNAQARKRLCDGYMTVRQGRNRAQQSAKAHDQELEFIYRQVDAGRVIDVGCGGGCLLERMPADKWGEKWGTEMGADAVERARQTLCTDKIFEDEVEDLDLPEAYFDLAIARGVIEHVPSPRTFLHKVASLVRPGGYFFMSGPNLDGFCARFYKDRWNLHYLEAHLFHFSVPLLSAALAEEGFRLVADRFPYLETPYAHLEKDFTQIANDIRASRRTRRRSFRRIPAVLRQPLCGHLEKRSGALTRPRHPARRNHAETEITNDSSQLDSTCRS